MIKYISSEDVKSLGFSWANLISLIDETLITMKTDDFSQPIKPYLRYRNPSNRMIAMPAFVGGNINAVGIKWIASFPENIKQNLPRAHALTILNDPNSGELIAILSANQLSALRTVAVSGYVIKKCEDQFPHDKLTLGIIGFGPIGKLHAEMASELLGNKLEKILVYDRIKKRVEFDSCSCYHSVDSWEEAYLDADIFITCTAATERYIDRVPKKNALLLNVSLRDFFPKVVMDSSLIIVDDWNEVCRENTDIEKAFLELGLKRKDTVSLKQFSEKKEMKEKEKGFISFHPMGMAVFDIALSHFFYIKACKEKIGVALSK